MNELTLKYKIDQLNEMIGQSNNIVFFGGAGVSTASGIPDFRSKDGLYNQHDINFEGYTPEWLLSDECLYTKPSVFFEFYRQKLDTRSIKPNITHYKLAELEKAGKLRAVITQNIDGLHQKAGSKNVYELHGTTQKNYCIKCNKQYSSDYVFENKDCIPRCDCNSKGMIRPDIILYGERLPGEAFSNAKVALDEADMLIIAGTSLAVYPAANLVNDISEKCKYVVIINKECTDGGLHADLYINTDMTEVFKELIIQ